MANPFLAVGRSPDRISRPATGTLTAGERFTPAMPPASTRIRSIRDKLKKGRGVDRPPESLSTLFTVSTVSASPDTGRGPRRSG